MLYEMLAGEPPHTGPTTQVIIAKIITDKLRPVTELREAVPASHALAVHTAKVREVMGHADLRTTMGYTHLVRENLRSLVDPVGRSWEGPAGTDAKPREGVGVAG